MKYFLLPSALLCWVLFVASAVTGFVVLNGSSRGHSFSRENNLDVPLRPFDATAVSYPIALQLQKGKKNGISPANDPKAGIDYGKILVLFVDPRNPYSWFLYMLGFITIYGTFSGN